MGGAPRAKVTVPFLRHLACLQNAPAVGRPPFQNSPGSENRALCGVGFYVLRAQEALGGRSCSGTVTRPERCVAGHCRRWASVVGGPYPDADADADAGDAARRAPGRAALPVTAGHGERKPGPGETARCTPRGRCSWAAHLALRVGRAHSETAASGLVRRHRRVRWWPRAALLRAGSGAFPPASPAAGARPHAGWPERPRAWPSLPGVPAQKLSCCSQPPPGSRAGLRVMRAVRLRGSAARGLQRREMAFAEGTSRAPSDEGAAPAPREACSPSSQPHASKPRAGMQGAAGWGWGAQLWSRLRR